MSFNYCDGGRTYKAIFIYSTAIVGYLLKSKQQMFYFLKNGYNYMDIFSLNLVDNWFTITSEF